jgi:cytochrome c biogenesis protein CcdA
MLFFPAWREKLAEKIFACFFYSLGLASSVLALQAFTTRSRNHKGVIVSGGRGGLIKRIIQIRGMVKKFSGSMVIDMTITLLTVNAEP